MFLSDSLTGAIENALSVKGLRKPLFLAGSVSGGSINSCYKLSIGGEFFFLKINSLEKYPRMFLAEAEGLKLIRHSKAVRVPKVIACGASDNEQFILMEWIEEGRNNAEVQRRLGRGLAALHRHPGAVFGLEYNNYIGSFQQLNTPHSSWTDFYIAERLQPQIKRAVDAGLLDIVLIRDFEKLFIRLDGLYPKEKPALVHGDLWSGNFMVGVSAEPILIDPSVSYSHREVDIAMTVLFGGFDKAFYRSYEEDYPLEKGWEKRLDLWSLYPLLVHLNLFGASYSSQLCNSLRRYV